MRESLLLLSALSFSVGQATWAMLLLLGLVVVEVILREPVWQPTAIDRSIVFLAVVLLASALVSEWRVKALTAVAEFVVGAFVVIRAVVLSSLRSREFGPRFLTAWAIGGVAAGLAALAASTVLPERRAVLPHHGANALGTALAMALVLLLGLSLHASRRRRVVIAGGLLVVGAGLLVTWSRGAWLGALIGIAVLAGTTSLRRMVPGALALVAVAAVALTFFAPQRQLQDARFRVALDPADPQSRTTVWRAVPRIVADHPLLGTGFATFVLVYPRYAPPPHIPGFPPHAHNLLLNFAAESGLLGALAFVIFLAASVLAVWRWYAGAARGSADGAAGRTALAMLAALMGHQLVDATLLGSPIAFGFYALVGLAAAEDVRRST